MDTAALESRYGLRADTLELGGRAVQFLRPAAPNALMDAMQDADFGPDEKMPYWAELWPAAVGLAAYLLAGAPLTGLPVLELGCGTGLAGIAAAMQGGQVLATDWYAEALDFVQVNAALNGTQVRTAVLDWRTPPAERFPLVLGADLLYERRNHAPLLQCLLHTLTPGGTAVFSDPCRQAALPFAAMARGMGYAVTRTDTQALLDGRSHAIHLYTLKLPE